MVGVDQYPAGYGNYPAPVGPLCRCICFPGHCRGGSYGDLREGWAGKVNWCTGAGSIARANVTAGEHGIVRVRVCVGLQAQRAHVGVCLKDDHTAPSGNKIIYTRTQHSYIT